MPATETIEQPTQTPPAISTPIVAHLVESDGLYTADPFEFTIDLSKNGRFDKPSLERIKKLANDMASEGQLQPIKARRGENTLSVTFGFHRALAAQWGIQNKVLPDSFRLRYELDETPDDKSSYLTNVGENVRRAELTTMDKAAIYQRLMTEFGMTSKDASEAVGHKKQWGNAVSKLLTLPMAYQRLIHWGRMSAEMGYEVAMLGTAAYPVVDALIAKAAGGPVLLPVWRDAWRKYKEQRKEGQDAAQAADIAADGGLDPTTGQDDQIGDDGKQQKKKVNKGTGVAGTGDTVLKRSASDVKKFFTAYVEEAEDKKSAGVTVAKKFLTFVEGKSTDAAMIRFMNSLSIS